MSIITDASPMARSTEELAELHDRLFDQSRDEILDGVRQAQRRGVDLADVTVIVADPQDRIGFIAAERFAPPGAKVDFALVYTMVVDREVVAELFDSMNAALAKILRMTKPKAGTVRCVLIAFDGTSYKDIAAPEAVS
jgi:hypothetical protein